VSKAVKILRLLAPILLVNIGLAFFFTFSSWYFWDRLSGFDLTHSRWTPFEALIQPVFLNKGQLYYMPDCFPITNYPFILFWVSTIANLTYIVWLLQKSSAKLEV
jgi:hypothetical protein